MRAEAICDGRGNAGTGARACVLILETGETIEKAEKLDPTTNIVAEHLAIQLALKMAIDAGVRRLLVWNDSRSPVNHLLGTYKVKQDHLRPIVNQTRELGLRFESFEIEWVAREKTVRPDKLCREIDKRSGAR
jgi:ribonuclease HI